MPTSCSALARASPAVLRDASWSGCIWIDTSLAMTNPTVPGEGTTTSIRPPFHNWETQNACIKLPKAAAKLTCSSSLRSAMPISHLGLNDRILFPINVSWSGRNVRLDRNLANSKFALAASLSASAARASASAIILSPASLARLSKNSSPHTPIRISAVEATVNIDSSQSFPRINTATISTANPNNIKNARRSALVEFLSYVDFRSPLPFLSLFAGLIRPHGKRSRALERTALILTIASLVALTSLLIHGGS